MKTGQKCRADARLTFGVMGQKRTKERSLYRLLQVLFSADQDVIRWGAWRQWLLHPDNKLSEYRLGRLYFRYWFIVVESCHLALSRHTLASWCFEQKEVPDEH